MNLTWHIIRKDLVRFRVPLIAWILLMAARYLVAAEVTGVFGQLSPVWLRQFDLGYPFFFLNLVADPLIAFFLAAALVFEDPPSGRDPFWVTRPISGLRLFFAKLLGAGLTLVVLPVLVAMPWWWACNFDFAHIIDAAKITAEISLIVVFAGLACASMVDGYPRYVVWTLVGLAVVFGTHMGAAMVHTPRQLQMVWPLGCIPLVAIEILCHRFATRHFRYTLGVLVAVTLGVSSILFTVAPERFDNAMSGGTVTFPGEEKIAVRVDGGIQTFLKGGMVLPLRLDELPPNIIPEFRLRAKWKSDDGKVWPVPGDMLGRSHAMRRTVRHLLGLPPLERDTPTELVSFKMPEKNSQRILAEATSVEGTIDGYLSEAQLLAEIPLRERTQRIPNGTLSISNLALQKGEATLILTARTADEFQPTFRYGYLALLSRRTGEIIEPSQNERLASSPVPQFNRVYVTSALLRFVVPDANWLEDATLVAANTRFPHPFQRTIAAYHRTDFHALSFDPPSSPVPAEILREYAGVYQPTPATTVTLLVEQDHLMSKGPQMGMRIGLFPVSETTFVSPHVGWFTVTNGGFQIEFQRDAGGKVSGFVVHQNGRDYVVPRVPDKK